MTAVVLRRRKLGLGSCNGIKQFSKQNISWVRNDKAFPINTNIVFRWGCTSDVPAGVTVVNSAKAIHTVADKSGFRKITADKGLAPKTWLSYEAYEKDQDWEFNNNIEMGVNAKLPNKVVVRRSTHHQGRYLHVASTYEEMCGACLKYGEGNYYISEFIDKVEEYRVFIVSGRAVWVAKKTPGNPQDVAWNVAQGGRFDNVRFDDWPLRVVKTAREAFLLSGLDFGGVDVMVDKAGKPYVLEINSAPSQTSPYRQECTAKAFDYIVQHGKGNIPVTEEKGGYLKFIHPAISDKAIMV